MKHLGNKPVPLKLVSNPPQLGIDRLNPLHVLPGPPPMLRVRRYCPCFAFRCSWSGGLATVHPAPVPVCDDGVLAGRALASFSETPLTRPMGTEPRCHTRFDELLMVN